MEELASFAKRLSRFDPRTVIRVESGNAWARLPWDVVVRVQTDAPPGIYAASALATIRPGGEAEEAIAHARLDPALWRGLLPAVDLPVAEIVPAQAIRSAAAAAAETLRQLSGKAGERAIRDALLDHIVVKGHSDVDGSTFEVPQRLVQAVVRMGFAATGDVEIRAGGVWTALVTERGGAYFRRGNALSVQPIVNQLKGR